MGTLYFKCVIALSTIAIVDSIVQTANSALVYSLARQTNNPFSIDPNTGEVLLQNSLDFEITPNYEVSASQYTFIHYVY